MFVKVIPVQRLQRKLYFFDYFLPKDLENSIQIGQLVKIPFKYQIINGLIINFSDKSSVEPKTIKPIAKIISLKPVLLEPQIDLILQMADYYNISPGHILKAILPEIPARQIKFIPAPLRFIPPKKIIKIHKVSLEKIKISIADILKSQNKPFLLHHQFENDKIAIVSNVIKSLIKQNKQVLYLVPQIAEIKNIYSIYKDFAPIAVLHSKMSKSTYWQEWQKILDNRAKIIIGTRSALFAPCNNLGLIVIDSEDSSDYKQSDQNPRYDARLVSELLAKITNSKLIFSSQAPRVECFYQAEVNKLYNKLDLSKIADKNISIVDLNLEIQSKNYSPISDELMENITKALQNNQKTLLYLDQRGFSKIFTCLDCSFIFRCPSCLLPFTFHSDKLLCHHCNIQKETSLNCPQCKGTNLKSFGLGTQKIESVIKKLFPKIEILRIDKDINPKDINFTKEYQLIIGTQFLVNNFPQTLENLGLIGIISSDTMFYIPDFRSNEKTFQKFAKLINSSPLKAKIIIQSFQPQNYVIKSLSKNDYGQFFEQEIKSREEFSYPPFSQLIKLSYKNKNTKKVDFEADKLFQILKENSPNVEILGPITGLKQHQKFIKNIIIKIEPRSINEISRILEPVYSDWIIDIDPENLF